MKKLAVVGLGYVGLPLAVQAAEKGYDVTGIDLNKDLINQINERTSPFANDERFAKALKKVDSSHFSVTTSFAKASEADVVIICVPTPTEDNIPDLRFVLAAAESVALKLRKGQLIVLESTVNPGVTREEVLPILEGTSNLKCGEDFYLAHCPERIDPGNPTYYVGNLNRVVGGITAECTAKTVALYKNIVNADIIPLDSTEEAEFVKSWENSHRNVLIALANEAAMICDAMGMDIKNVLKGLQSKIDQFGLKLGQPGLGPGGHCIPEDIHYVIKKARQSGIDTRFLDAAAELNDRMPRYGVQQLQSIISHKNEHIRNLRVALLGLAYKKNIEDARRSPSLEVAQILAQRAKSVITHDPFVQPEHIHVRGIEYTPDLEAALKDADAVFVATDHDAYQLLDGKFLKKYGIRYVLDGRNCLDRESIQDNGIAYKGIGR